MSDFSLEQSGEVAVLSINGAMTVDNSLELKELLLRALNGADHVVFDLEKVTDVDLSCLQILCSAHRTSARLNKKVTLGGIRAEVFLKAVECAGFERHTGCIYDTAKTCLWVKTNSAAPVSV